MKVKISKKWVATLMRGIVVAKKVALSSKMFVPLHNIKAFFCTANVFLELKKFMDLLAWVNS